MCSSVSSDATWWYVSIQLVGNDPNNKLGIDYGVELDTNHDGFGDYLLFKHSFDDVVAQGRFDHDWKLSPAQAAQLTASGAVRVR